ncbi:MAG: hypothetical protein ACK5GN_06100 [Pseudomonadota bacterium]|jgi:hypothetical protein
MKFPVSFKALILTLAALPTVAALQAAHASPSNSKTIFARCVIPSSSLSSLIRASVLQDLTAKQHLNPTASVTIVNRANRIPVTLSNAQGLSAITANPTGNGYTITTSGPVGMPCTMETTVNIRGAYTVKGQSRPTSFFNSIKLTFNGFLN